MSKKFEVEESIAIPGLYILNYPDFQDERGVFQQRYSTDYFRGCGVAALEGFADKGIAQVNTVANHPDAARGLHAEFVTKIVGMESGLAQGMWVDLRAGENFGAVETARLSRTQNVFVPKGVANGYMVAGLDPDYHSAYLINHAKTLDPGSRSNFLSGLLVYSYILDASYSETAKHEYNRMLRIDDPAINKHWGRDISTCIVKEADYSAPTLEEIRPIEVAL
jgi:dTDP-4-dehydrorhamnose 3,5-epimerase-like enzyme